MTEMNNNEEKKRDRIDIALFPGRLARGGAERVTVRLAEYFVSKGYKTAIITEHIKKDEDYSIPKGVMYYYATQSNDKFLAVIHGYRMLLNKYKPKCVLVMGTPLCCTVIPAAFGMNVKVIVSERNSPGQFAGRKITKILMRFMMKFADGYVFQTNQAMEYYGKRIQNRAAVISNPLITETIPERTYIDQNKIVGVGRLNPQKNWPMLIKAFSTIVKQYPEVYLVIYGEGEQRKELTNLIDALNLKEKVFLPGVSDRILEDEKDARLFVLPSNFEGMPNALMEAMAIGIPCIATDCPCGGSSYLIDNMKNGVLVPVGDKEALYDAICKLLDSAALSESIGTNAKWIRNEYDISAIGKRWMIFIEQTVCGEKFR